MKLKHIALLIVSAPFLIAITIGAILLSFISYPLDWIEDYLEL